MERYVLQFSEIDKTFLPYVGGKGANLGEMTKAGFAVPQGFCVTTWAYKNFIEQSKEISSFFNELEMINSNDLEKISKLGQEIRHHLNSMSMPLDIKESILSAFKDNGEDKAYAVRSSATAEDLPTASFAGQQDTYLNIRGQSELLKAIQNCWASLFTDRAISYRAKNNFDYKAVLLSVVVQEMVIPEVSGIMFTADPISGRRKTVSIDASFGLGEALVSGLVTADLYQVRDQRITKKQIAKKKVAIYSLPEGGTVTRDISPKKQEVQALSDDRIIELAALGQKIEAYYGVEQDIEWGFASGKFYILQSRPITSLYPLPKVNDDKFHVFISFGHIQMMIDAMKPLAISLMSNVANFLKDDPNCTDNYFIYPAGGRVFADITSPLLFKPYQKIGLKVFKGMDELIAASISEVIKREEFKKLSLSKKSLIKTLRKMAPVVIPTMIKVVSNLLFEDPVNARDKADLAIKRIVSETEKKIFAVSGEKKIQFIKQSMGNALPKVLSVAVYLIAGVIASQQLEKKLKKKIGEKETAILLSKLNKSLPGNVTTELVLELGDLADVARKSSEVIEYLKNCDEKTFYEELVKVKGGEEFQFELNKFLEKYGMRCSGEIDITKPRWSEDPYQIVPSIISNIQTTSNGEHRRKFNQGKIEAEQAEKEILSKFNFLGRLSVSRLVKLYRNLMGMREHHKFVLVKILDIYKGAILEEAESLVEKGILKNKEDVFFLTMEEINSMGGNGFRGDIQELIKEREIQFQLDNKRSVPRVVTSEGEIVTGKLRDVKVPKGAIVGTPVSAGIIEGVARVVVKLEDAKLNPGEILVAPYTDPGWTPLFTSAIALVTEVGGLMTHGSVVAREYGIPAVVGIERATEIIKDGDRIRVNGTEGFVEKL